MLLTVMAVIDSEPSVSVRPALMFSAMAVSSLPVAGDTVTVGTSATAFTVTARLAMVDVAVLPPAASVLVAVTFRVKSTSELAAGVSVRPDSCAGGKVQVPLPLLVPADSVAPDGMLLTVMAVMLSEPSVSVRPALRFSAMAVSSLPVAGETVTVGTSATAFTVTARLAMVLVAVDPPVASVLVAVTFRLQSTSALAAGRAVGTPAGGLRAGRRHLQAEVDIGVGRGRQRQARQLRRGQSPGAVAVVGAGRQRRARRHVADGDGRDALGAVGVGETRAEVQRNGRVFVAGGRRDGDRRHVGDRIHRHRQVGDGAGRSGPAGGLRAGRRHLQAAVDIGVGRGAGGRDPRRWPPCWSPSPSG